MTLILSVAVGFDGRFEILFTIPWEKISWFRKKELRIKIIPEINIFVFIVSGVWLKQN
jgi:hypothetical protein